MPFLAAADYSCWLWNSAHRKKKVFVVVVVM
jgi:hypothetical protein